jgi:predicted DCC family thiol-disulfide oxidoreductase YuxK
MENSNEKTVKVYYNSACPICNAGINRQKNKMPNCQIDWKDVHTQPSIYKDVSSNLELVRERLHAIDRQGEIRVGVDAFAVIWKDSPRERWKAVLVSLPGLKQISNLIYNIFAWFLYKWNRWKGRW